MNVSVKLVFVALTLCPFASYAQDAPKLNCLTDFVFSQEFLQKYPNAGAACREIVMKGDQKWARFDANVVDVRGEKITATFTSSNDRPLTTVTFVATPDARVEMNGKDIKFNELKKGDSLSFWMPEQRVGFYAAPGASESKRLAVVDDKTQQR
jgi:hypothetical protein